MSKVAIDPNLVRKIEAAAVDTALALAQEMAFEAKSKHPFSDQSGNLEGSISAEAQSDGALFKIDSPHAAFVEYGHIAPDGSMVAPRAFIRPAIKKAMKADNVKGKFRLARQKKDV
jgi:phage gpG-like protein